jgi:hypothetical protein
MATEELIGEHSRENAERMLHDQNYPTPFERKMLLERQPDDYSRKHVENLLAMIDFVRDDCTDYRE